MDRLKLLCNNVLHIFPNCRQNSKIINTTTQMNLMQFLIIYTKQILPGLLEVVYWTEGIWNQQLKLVARYDYEFNELVTFQHTSMSLLLLKIVNTFSNIGKGLNKLGTCIEI